MKEDDHPALVDADLIEGYLRYYSDALDVSPAKLATFILSSNQAFVSRDFEAIKEYAASHARSGADVYLHTNLHHLPEGMLYNSRGSIASAAGAIMLSADVDSVGPGRKKPTGTLCPSVDAAIGIVDEFDSIYAPLTTGLIIASGYGCYPEILFKEFLAFTDESSRLQFEELNRRFHLALHRIASSHGWLGAVEYCDLAKLQRLPGCLNWKNRREPKPVAIARESPARFNPLELDELLPPIEKRVLANGIGAATPGPRIALNARPQVNPDLLASLIKNHPLFESTWNHRRTGLNDQSCSAYDLSLANIGVACGLRDQQIADLLIANRLRFAGEKKNRRGNSYRKYLLGRIALARAGKTTSEAAERQWQEFEAARNNDQTDDPAVPPQPATRVVQDVEPGSPNSETGVHAGVPLTSIGAPHGYEGPTSEESTDFPAETPPENLKPAREQMIGTPGAEAGPSFEPSLEPSPANEENRSQDFADDNQSDFGQNSASTAGPEEPDAVEALLSGLRAAADISLVYKNIDILARLTNAELAIAWAKLKDILRRKLIRPQFEKAIKEARDRQRAAEAEKARRQRSGEHPYRLTGNGIVRVLEKKDAIETIPLTNFIATIKEDITEDDGVETKRFFLIDAVLGNKIFSFVIPASELSAMEWAIRRIGPKAIVYPNQKEWARTAIQTLSTGILQRQTYTHTGWRKIGDVHLYLHAGGAIGGMGAAQNIDVRLHGPLAHYQLQLPRSNEELIKAIQASLRVIGLAHNAGHITFVLLAAIYRACLRACDFSIWIGGPTGVFKTELAALAQQHFGAEMKARQLPSSFSSTANSLEALAFSAKDAVLVTDDFAPHGGMQDVARYHAAADRLLRAAGNSQGRGRLSSDARLREAKPPRGLIVVTGEDLPKGQSIKARTFMIEMARGDIDPAALTKCQADAASGLYAQSMAGFIQHIAANYAQVQAEYAGLFAEHREKATKAHARTPGIIADLYIGFKLFLDFAVAAGAITDAQREDLAARCWAALEKVAKAQRVQQEASEPARRFLELLRAAISSGAAHVAGHDGEAPGDPATWGWYAIGAGDNERFAGAGKRIGWIKDSQLYLEPTASYVAAQEIARGAGEPLAVGETTLHKRLHEAGLLASVDKARETYKIRKKLQGTDMEVLHFLASVITKPTRQSASRAAGTEKFRC